MPCAQRASNAVASEAAMVMDGAEVKEEPPLAGQLASPPHPDSAHPSAQVCPAPLGPRGTAATH
jgi:hypothetical protein